MSEEDQMMRAIALSLGQDVTPMAVDQVILPSFLTSGLKITAGQRTMTGQNKHLTGQTSFEN